MSSVLTFLERRWNAEIMLCKFRQDKWRTFGKIKNDRTRTAVWLLAWTYIYCDDTRLYAHEDALKHAIDTLPYLLDGERYPVFIHHDSNGFQLDPLSRGQYQFVTDWFTQGINWAEERRATRKMRQKIAQLPHTMWDRELVAT